MPNVAIGFDTHRFVKRLTEHGFTQEQAEALADEQVNLLNENLATKNDIRELSLKMERDIKELSLKMERDIKELALKTGSDIKESENRLLRWMGAGFISLVGLLIALLLS